MSFKVFIYYCATCGGWAAFLTWGILQAVGDIEGTGFGHLLLVAAVRGALLGTFVAAAVGILDALLNSTGQQRFVRAAVCAGLGLLSGIVGATIGQALNYYLWVPLFVGWMLVGMLIGASIGFYDVIGALRAKQDVTAAFRKSFNGILGGCIGGLVGGLPYTFLIGNTVLPRSSLPISLVILGACIGLMIGLAQVILKEAWVKVEEGFRAGRELMLTKEETTIGRAESCDLGLFGDTAIQKLHACILLENNRYLLSHLADEGETYVNDRMVAGSQPVPLRGGDRIRLGKSVLVFGERQKRQK
jgi:hypothetical protein